MNSICIIPARGGSKRIPRKNITPLNGIPLLAYTVRAAVKARVFDTIVVSSEDEEIQSIAYTEGVDVDKRPQSLAGDNVTKVEVIKKYLERTNAAEYFDTVAALLPTCPFRKVEDIKNPVEIFLGQTEQDFLLSVVEYDFPIQLALEPSIEQTMTMVDKEGYQTTRSQNIKKHYHPNGAIYLARIGAFLKKGTFFNNEMMTYEMPAERSWDIDYPWQWEVAEVLAKKYAYESG